MILKFQTNVPGEQPNITAKSVATIRIPSGPRVGVLYCEMTVTKAAGGGGVYSLPLVTDIIHPTQTMKFKIDGREQRQRLVSELIALNKLQGSNLGGSVDYIQDGVVVATVYDAGNTAVPAGIVANKATTAVFQVPIYLAEYFRKDVATGEGMAWPTAFNNGKVLPAMTVEIPIADNALGAFSNWGAVIWFDYDGLQWAPDANGNARSLIVRQGRSTKLYGAVGDFQVSLPQQDRLMQFSLLLAAGDAWSRCIVKKNGTTLRDVTPARNRQVLFDHGLNVAAVVPNRCDIVLDLNDDVNAALPLNPNDTFEVTLTLSSVAGNATMVILSESYGFPI